MLKLENNEPRPKFTGSYKKKHVSTYFTPSIFCRIELESAMNNVCFAVKTGLQLFES